jgi:anti-sigma-K factor RskA
MAQLNQPSDPEQDRGREQPSQPGSQPSQGLIPRWAWSATAVLVLLAAYTTWRSQRMSKQFADLEEHATEEQQLSQALQSEQLNYQQILNIVAAKATKRIQFKPAQSSNATTTHPPASKPPQKSANPGAVPGAGANGNVSAITAYLNPQMGLVLSADKMSEMPAGHTLQLWIVPLKGAPTRAAIFRPDANGQILLVTPATPEIASAKSLSITDEPAGASSQPTVAPAWTASVP